MGRLVPAEEDVGSEVSEWELLECREREEGRRAETEMLGAAEEVVLGRSYRCSYPHPLSWHPQTRFRGRAVPPFCSFFCSPLIWICFLCDLLGAPISWGRPGRRATGSLQRAATARTADEKTGQKVRRHSLVRLYASMNKQEKISRSSAYHCGSFAVSVPQVSGVRREARHYYILWHICRYANS